MDNAILYAGAEELRTIKEHVLELNGYQERNAELLKEENRLERLLAGKEKELSDEIESTLKKRKNAIVTSYETQLSTLGSRRKKIKAKKEKEKSIKVSERVGDETAELREANKCLQIDIRANLKKNKTPRLCNNMLFYALFMPKTVVEFLILALVVLLMFFALPFGVYQLFLAENFGAWTLAVVYIADVVLFGGAYLLINNLVKEKHKTTLSENRELREEYRKNCRTMKEIQKGIESDEDESSYGLERFDEELNEIEAEIQRVATEEKEELTKFENVTSGELTAGIQARYREELEALRTRSREVEKEQKEVEEKVKEYSLMLSKQYETYLGTEMLTVAKLDRLISRIEKGEASNIGEALALEKESKGK